jgi:hypothetical protein
VILHVGHEQVQVRRTWNNRPNAVDLCGRAGAFRVPCGIATQDARGPGGAQVHRTDGRVVSNQKVARAPRVEAECPGVTQLSLGPDTVDRAWDACAKPPSDGFCAQIHTVYGVVTVIAEVGDGIADRRDEQVERAIEFCCLKGTLSAACGAATR